MQKILALAFTFSIYIPKTFNFLELGYNDLEFAFTFYHLHFKTVSQLILILVVIIFSNMVSECKW